MKKLLLVFIMAFFLCQLSNGNENGGSSSMIQANSDLEPVETPFKTEDVRIMPIKKTKKKTKKKKKKQRTRHLKIRKRYMKTNKPKKYTETSNYILETTTITTVALAATYIRSNNRPIIHSGSVGCTL